MNPVTAFLCGYLACLITLIPAAILLYLFKPWMRAFLTGTGTSLFHLLGARLRGSPVNLLLDAQIALIQRGMRVHFYEVERAYLANRNRISGLGDLIGFTEERLAASGARSEVRSQRSEQRLDTD